ncbi:MAG: biotin/lipoyl-containing protein, partial [Solirubrobacteraceae bacterium]
MADVSMPRLSDSMEEGTILKWLKSDGDEVRRGDELVEIETDKANMTYEADQDGVLRIVASEGDTLPVGEPIASIGGGAGQDGGGEVEEPAAGAEEQPEEQEEQEQPAAEEQQPEEQEQPAAAEERPEPEPEPEPEPAGGEAPADDGAGNGRIKASPVARRMAREMGLELARVEGTGPGGRIVKADVEAAAGGGPGDA